MILDFSRGSERIDSRFSRWEDSFEEARVIRLVTPGLEQGVALDDLPGPEWHDPRGLRFVVVFPTHDSPAPGVPPLPQFLRSQIRRSRFRVTIHEKFDPRLIPRQVEPFEIAYRVQLFDS